MVLGSYEVSVAVALTLCYLLTDLCSTAIAQEKRDRKSQDLLL